MKRAERPPEAFWLEFEEQLRAKQLAAIVGRRPWWQVDLSKLTSSFRGLRFPIGAVAALAFAFVAVREHPQRVGDGEQPLDLPEGSPGIGSAVVASAAPAVSALASAPEVAWGESAAADDAEMAEPALESAAVGASVNPAPAERVTPRVVSLLAAMDQAPGAPRGGFVAVGTLTEVSVAGLPGRSLLDSAAAVEPLTQITSPSEGRRARLAALVDMTSSEPRRRSSSDLRARERILDRLNEDELYLNFSRVGVDRGALSVRF